MTQEAVQITTTPPLPGLQLVQDMNKALETIATDFAGGTDPAAMAWPYSTWADTGTGTLKRRNAASSAWVIEGRLLRSHLPMYAQADVPALDIGPIYIIGKGPAEWIGAAYKILMPDFPSNDDLQWLGTPIGEEFSIHPSAPLPPTDDPNFRYVILTAGLTGAGQYNEGVLISEAVTGSDPTITATAVVSLAESPMNGETIDLINTSRVFPRPGPTSGPIVNSKLLSHRHTGPGAWSNNLVTTGNAPGQSVTALIDNTSTGVNTGIGLTGGDETAPRYIPRVYLMRIL